MTLLLPENPQSPSANYTDKNLHSKLKHLVQISSKKTKQKNNKPTQTCKKTLRIFQAQEAKESSDHI